MKIELDQLISLCLKQDRKAESALYKYCFTKLMPICHKYYKSKDDTLAQINKAFLKILNNLSSFDGNKSFDAWIKTIMVNTIIDEFRVNKKRNALFIDNNNELMDLDFHPFNLNEAEAKLTAAERERLAKLNNDEEDADQQKSLSDAGKYSGVSGRGGIAIKYALAQIGDKYVFGADGLTYWDCSGLTMRAFGAAGVSLPHSSRAQYRYGKAIARKDLQPGDLVFFGKPISHVAIYLGPDRMLHAPRSGSRVKIANMDMGRKPYIGARRL